MKQTPADEGADAARRDSEPREARLQREAEHALQPVDVQLLLAAARGEIDLNEIARRLLADLGLNREGSWVGHERAHDIWGLDRGLWHPKRR